MLPAIILQYHALQVQLGRGSWIKELELLFFLHYKKVSAYQGSLAQNSFILVLFCIYNQSNWIN